MCEEQVHEVHSLHDTKTLNSIWAGHLVNYVWLVSFLLVMNNTDCVD